VHQLGSVPPPTLPASQEFEEHEGEDERARSTPMSTTTHRGTGKARKSVEPITPWDTIVAFHAVHAWDTWLSPLTWETVCM
jgi:hypothetical protein